MDGSAVICSLRGVTVTYRDAMAVSGVDIDIRQGELTCLVGANGAGKSSLLKAIVGLIPYSGVIQLSVSPTEIAYLSQLDTATRDFPATVYEVVHSGRQRKGRLICRHEDHEMVDKALEMLSVAHIRGRPISRLSGGQLQRVRLARAFCTQPKLLILDEPTGGLDAAVSAELYAVLRQWNAEQGITIFMATHDIAGIGGFASRVIAVSRGGIVFDGSAGAWLESERPGI